MCVCVCVCVCVGCVGCVCGVCVWGVCGHTYTSHVVALVYEICFSLFLAVHQLWSTLIRDLKIIFKKN